MKSAAVLTVDGAFALFLHLCGRAWQIKCPSPWEFAIHSKRMFMPCPGVHWVGGGGMLGGVGSTKIDWCIIVALLLIQALVEDKQLWSLITRTKSLSSQPNHSSFKFSTCLLHPRGEEVEPLFVCLVFSFEGFSLEQKLLLFFFSYLKPVPYECHLLFLLAVTTAFIISVFLSELLPTVLL